MVGTTGPEHGTDTGQATATSPVLAADVVLLHPQGEHWYVLLIQRGWAPYAGCWALPGGLVEPGETFATAARRELAEETGLPAPADLAEVGVYDAPDRDPRGRVISVAYVGVLPEQAPASAGDDAVAARWVPVAEILADPRSIAFDHHSILRAALSRVQQQRDNNDLAEQVWTLSAALHDRTLERDQAEARLSELDTPAVDHSSTQDGPLAPAPDWAVDRFGLLGSLFPKKTSGEGGVA